jgi:hypothetical protein
MIGLFLITATQFIHHIRRIQLTQMNTFQAHLQECSCTLMFITLGYHVIYDWQNNHSVEKVDKRVYWRNMVD